MFEESRPVWRDELIDPYWIHDSALGEGKVKHLENSEISFWRQLQEKYLTPLLNDPEEQKRVSDELKELRNKVCLFYFLLNAIYVVIIVTLQYVQTSQGLLRVNATCYIYGPDEPKEMMIEPLSVVFMGVFGLLLFIQLLAMLFHRLSTFLHINAATKLSHRKDKDDTARKIQIARQLQMLHDAEDDDVTSVVTEGSNQMKGGRIVRRLAKRQRRKQMMHGTLRARFISNIHKVITTMEGEEDPAKPLPKGRFKRRATSKFQNAMNLLKEQKEATERLRQIVNFMKLISTNKQNERDLPLPRRRWLNAYKKVKQLNREAKASRRACEERLRRMDNNVHMELNYEDNEEIPLGGDAGSVIYRNLRAPNSHEQTDSEDVVRRRGLVPRMRDSGRPVGGSYMMNSMRTARETRATAMFEENNEALY